MSQDKDYATTFYQNSDNTRTGKKYYQAVIKERDRKGIMASAAFATAVTSGYLLLNKML